MTHFDKSNLIEDWPRLTSSTVAASHDDQDEKVSIHSSQASRACSNDNLLVEWDWPRRTSSKAEQDNQDHQDDQVVVDFRPTSSGVHFMEFSKLHIYEKDDLNLKKNMAYSSMDCDMFKADAMIEAHRIKDLIRNSPPDSVKESIKYLFKSNFITRDELVGIDHLVLRERAHILKVRRDHMMAVLWKQHEQRQQQQKQQQRQRPQPAEGDFAIELGKFAAQSSFKSTRVAIARATLGATTLQKSSSSANAA
jgi:hypothetical protein